MAQLLKDKLSRNPKNNLIGGGIALLAIAGITAVVLVMMPKASDPGAAVSETQPEFEDPQKIFEQTVPKPDSPVVAMLKGQDYSSLATHFAKPTSGENLAQVMYFYDTTVPDAAVQRKIVTELVKGFDAREKIPPKEAIVLSKIIGRSALERSERQAVEKLYKKRDWMKKSFWVEATVGWNPIPATTLKSLEAYGKSSLNHERNDFRYFYARLNDPKAQAKLKTLATSEK